MTGAGLHAKEEVIEGCDDRIAVRSELTATVTQIAGSDGCHARYEQDVVDVQNANMRSQATCGAGQFCLGSKRRHDPFTTGVREVGL